MVLCKSPYSDLNNALTSKDRNTIIQRILCSIKIYLINHEEYIIKIVAYARIWVTICISTDIILSISEISKKLEAQF